jgi:hypothetical protein
MSSTEFSSDPQASQGSATDGTNDTKEQAKQAAGTAKDESKRVAGVAKDEAQRVTDEAKTQVRALLDETTSQLDEQSRVQQTKLAETVRTFAEDLSSMTAQTDASGGMAAQLVQEVSDRARTLAAQLEDREPRELLDDVRTFARRRPGTFLLGALAAGVVVGRLTRGAKAAQDQTSSGAGAALQPSQPPMPTVTTGAPTAAPGTGYAGRTDPGTPGNAPLETELGAPGVELSEGGIVGPGGGRA